MLPAVAATAGTGADAGTEPLPGTDAFVVSLHPDGSATVRVVVAYDLTTANERDAFEALRANETRQATLRDRFADRLSAVAANAADETGRDTRVSDPAIAFPTRNDTGLVVLAATWHGFAATDGDRIVVTQPFDDGFDTGQRVVLQAPADYTFTALTPTADATPDDRTAAWHANTSLDGFEAIASPSPTSATTGGQTSAETPGFGLLAALAALAATLVLAASRGRRRRR